MTVFPLEPNFRTDPTMLTERVAAQTAESPIWEKLVAARFSAQPSDVADEPVYGPLVVAGRESRLVIGQFGQSLDGRIATPSGESKYLNGAGGLSHLHRLRALVDAVVVGVSTVVADDPMLTVRMVHGANPARVVIDPNGRVDRSSRMFIDDGGRRIVVTSERSVLRFEPGIEIIRIAEVDGRLPPAAIIAALAEVGLPQMLVEGGSDTVSRFLQAGMLDRLHVSVAPVLVGGGRSGITLSNVQGLADCLRPRIDVHRLGEDILFDCVFQTRGQIVTTPNSP